MKFLIQLLMKIGLADYVASQLEKPNGFFGSRFIGRMMNRGNAHLEQLAFNLANIEKHQHVLEIGFGNGQQLKRICSAITSGKVHGVDISEDLINQVTNGLQAYVNSNKLQLHLAGVSNIPLQDNTIDCIITCNTIYFWPEPLADAKELHRVLKPNGKLICGYRTADEMANYPFVTQNPEIFKNHLTDKEVEHLFLEAGFSDVKMSIEESDLAPSHVAVAIT